MTFSLALAGWVVNNTNMSNSNLNSTKVLATTATIINTTYNRNYDLYVPSLQYVCFGSLAVATNLLILFILLRNFGYFKASAFIAGLALGDFIDGLSLAMVGAVRIAQYWDGSSILMVHPTYCMKTLITPLFLLGNQLPGLMFFLVGIERFLAVVYYEWYYLRWSNKFAWMLTSSAYIYSLLSVGAAFVITYRYDANVTTSISCGVGAVMPASYSAYNYMVAVVGGTVAVLATIGALVSFTKRKCATNLAANVKSHVKRQWHLTRVTLGLAVVDFGLLVVPSFIITLSSGFNVAFNNLNLNSVKAWSLQLVCFRSILNVLFYLFVNSEFRLATYRAFNMKKGNEHSISNTNIVTPIVTVTAAT